MHLPPDRPTWGDALLLAVLGAMLLALLGSLTGYSASEPWGHALAEWHRGLP